MEPDTTDTYDLQQRIIRLLSRHQQPADRRHDLEPMRRLMAGLGSPHRRLRVVHVAATSGKTSTCVILRDYLQALGVRTGLTVSPHITSVRERVQVDGEPASAGEFVAALDRVSSIVAEQRLPTPSYFELILTIALCEFVRADVGVAVLETGIGGVLDATNITDAPGKVCVIGRIGLDHTEILGDTIELIAAQKCGIIHPGNTVVALRQGPAVDRVIAAHADSAGATLTWVDDTDSHWYIPGGTPRFQRANIALAQATLSALHRVGWLPRRPRPAELPEPTFPPGRFEWLTVGGRRVLLDGAHNPQKLASLFDSLPAAHYGELAPLVGFVRGPDAKLDAMLDRLAARVREFGYVDFIADQDVRDKRSFSVDAVAAAAENRGLRCIRLRSMADAVEWLLQQPGQPVVVGSLYLVASVRHALLTRRPLSGMPPTR